MTDTPCKEEAMSESYLGIDLDQFCHHDKAFIARPFSLDGHTYATNGAILVRVPVINGFGAPEGAPEGFHEKLNQILSGIEEKTYFDLPLDKIPAPPDDIDCPACRGRGHKHDCPNCQCECEQCLGDGHVPPDDALIINRHPFASVYLRMIASLPNPKMTAPQRRKADGKYAPIAFFRFDTDGFGALMGLDLSPGRKDSHIKLGE
jgi:hypothetical protein